MSKLLEYGITYGWIPLAAVALFLGVQQNIDWSKHIVNIALTTVFFTAIGFYAIKCRDEEVKQP